MLIKNKKIISVATQRPLRKNIKYIFRPAGRNNQGRLVVRHQGGGVKQLYRVID
jgi:large subunit ribosomal protein L2